MSQLQQLVQLLVIGSDYQIYQSSVVVAIVFLLDDTKLLTAHMPIARCITALIVVCLSIKSFLLSHIYIYRHTHIIHIYVCMDVWMYVYACMCHYIT
jgi:hypothetical protein